MEFKPYLDTRELSEEAQGAVDVGQALLAGDENLTSQEIHEASNTIRAMSNALKSLGYNNFLAEEIPDLWIAVGNNIHVTLVREDTIGEYWSEAAIDFGRLTRDQAEEFESVIDWEAYARNQDGTVVNFALPDSYGLNAKPINYYIF